MSLGVVDVSLYVRAESVRQLCEFFFEGLLCKFAPELDFHFVDSFKLYRRRMSSSNALSILACVISCSIRAKSLCRPTLAAIAMMYSGRKSLRWRSLCARNGRRYSRDASAQRGDYSPPSSRRDTRVASPPSQLAMARQASASTL
jgi:hypothetical protein